MSKRQPSEYFDTLREETIQSQYDASPTINALTRSFCAEIDPTEDIKSFRTNIFDIDTAQGWGLDNWGRILGASRDVAVFDRTNWFGFDGSLLQPLNEAPFYMEFTEAEVTVKISDEAYRSLLLYKAAANISDSTVRDLNRLLSRIYDEKFVCVLETAPMHLRFVFGFTLTDFEWAVLKKYVTLCRPAGVDFGVYELDVEERFGFDGSGLETFDNGTLSQLGVLNYEEA